MPKHTTLHNRVQSIIENRKSPVDFLVYVMWENSFNIEQRMRAAEMLLPYVCNQWEMYAPDEGDPDDEDGEDYDR